MPDRFVSGQTTSKFEVPLPTKVADTIHSYGVVQAATVNMVEELKKDVNKRFDDIKSETTLRFDDIYNYFEPTKEWVMGNYGTTDHVNYSFGVLICKLASNPIVRFLNRFFHWFNLSIFQNNMWSSYRHDKYYVLVTISDYEHNPDICGLDYKSKRWKARLRENYKYKQKYLKRDLRQIKSEGYKLSNMHFRF